ncbi:MAG: transglutaminase-like domain-containing protein [Firmicutes bacterium]|jgi:transglutaminase-like putative cysteine protease|nr:transglutaminase-like domain-containing protein [Bacillota bacterium]
MFVADIGGEMVKLRRLATVALAVVFSGLVSLTPAVHAANQPISIASSLAIPTLPAHYVFTQKINLTNTTNVPAYNVKADVVLLPAETSYSRVSLAGESQPPVAVSHDAFGNLIGTFLWSTLAPHQTVQLTLHYTDTSYDVSYRLPRNYPSYNTDSPTYRTFTNPQLEEKQVNTDSPVLEQIVHQVVQPGQNPEQQAHALFSWIVHNIQYNYTLKPSGSAVATAQSHLGICSDIADLYVGLLRTDHIPARFVGGYVTNNGSGQGGFHQWTEFYLPSVGWVVADPTWGAYGYFAALQDDWHIALYDGIRKDIVVHWSYSPQALSGSAAKHQIAIHYQYHFTQSASSSIVSSAQARPVAHPSGHSRHADPPAAKPDPTSLWHRLGTWISHTAGSLVHWLTHL